jgi:hypothetical protein
MIDRMTELRKHQQSLSLQKFFVSHDQDGNITSVFASTESQDPHTKLEIGKDLAEGFLTGEILTSTYKVDRLGDSYVLQKVLLTNNITSNSSFYKIPNIKTEHTIIINKAASTIKMPDTLDETAVLYICAKNCFHILYTTIVYDPNVSVYSVETADEISIFVPAHIKDLGIQYE